jgi:uncharacterized protein YecT (DUF1311 family)
MQDYLDFELALQPGGPGFYAVRLLRSPAGEAEVRTRFPFPLSELESRLKDVTIALLRSSGPARRTALHEDEQTVQDFGRHLFEALLTDEVRVRFDVSRERALQQGKGLRLKLRIDSPELAMLPWEYLYDPRRAEYLCLMRDTPLVRYLELPQPPSPLAVAPPLQILGLIASPRDLPPLNVRREREAVEHALAVLRAGGLVQLGWVEGQGWRDLLAAMRGGPWHVLHFVGHGGYDRARDEGFIALVDTDGMSYRLDATRLGRLLADHPPLRLAVLNACEGARGGPRDLFSNTAAILVRRGVPAVLAMQFAISDQAALEFADSFYRALGDGLPVDAAVAEARKAIDLALPSSVEWGAPVLYTRAPDGHIFSLAGRPRTANPGKPAQRAWIGTRQPLGWLFRLAGVRWAVPVLLLVIALLAIQLALVSGIWRDWLGADGRSAPSAESEAAGECAVAIAPIFQTKWQQGELRTALGCPEFGWDSRAIALQRFDRGWMLFRDDGSGSFTALYSDGTWQEFVVSRDEVGSTVYHCPDLAPSTTPPTPREGFGYIWCTRPRVREQLGDALAAELRNTAQVQFFPGGTMLEADELGVLALLADGTWR